MSKITHTKRSKVGIYLEEFPNETFKWWTSFILSTLWKVSSQYLSIDQRGQIIQHINTCKHRGNRERNLNFQHNFISISSASINNSNSVLMMICVVHKNVQTPLFLNWKILHSKILWKNILVIKYGMIMSY